MTRNREEFELAVIGAGPGGYVAAIRAAQLGIRTVLIERDQAGGTCLNVGCIPSKALLQSSAHYAFCRDEAAQHGIVLEKPRVDLSSMMSRKTQILSSMRRGVLSLVNSRGVTFLTGHATFVSPTELDVRGPDRNVRVIARRVLVATGSEPVPLPFLPFDGSRVVNSTEALSWDQVPERLIVVGGGAIGLEMASVWSRLGSKVQVVEFLPAVAPTCDAEVAASLSKILQKQGIRLLTGTRILSGEVSDNTVALEAEREGQTQRLEADRVLIAVGRKPRFDSLGLDLIGLKPDAKGRLPVDASFQTKVPGVYAIGDVIEGPMLAHKAEEEAVVFAERLAGHTSPWHPDLIPSVIYTDPELASLGLTEAEAINRGLEIRVGRFPVAGNGRAIASGYAHGLVKLIADGRTDRILGVHVCAHGASELIASAVAHMTYGGSAEDLARTIHAHPTLSESLREAALDVDSRAIHLPPKR